MNKCCQSCGMPLVNENELGTNKDGSKNNEYCVYCYKNGKYTSDYSLDSIIESNLKYLDEWNNENGTNYTPEEARKVIKETLQDLKRWKCTCTNECADGYNPNCTCTSSECHCTEKKD